MFRLFNLKKLAFQLDYLIEDFRYCLNYYQKEEISKIVEDSENAIISNRGSKISESE
jgi:hypothetical protein